MVLCLASSLHLSALVCVAKQAGRDGTTMRVFFSQCLLTACTMGNFGSESCGVGCPFAMVFRTLISLHLLYGSLARGRVFVTLLSRLE